MSAASPLFPLELLVNIINVGPLGAINVLARTCRPLANYVRDHADRLARPHVYLNSLPNGTRHGIIIAYIGEKRVAVQYRLGTPANWQVTGDNHYMWGCVGSPFMITCCDQMMVSLICVVEVHVGDNFISAYVDGSHIWCDYQSYANRVAIEPLVGYLVDNKIQPIAINEWVIKLIDRIEAIRPAGRFSSRAFSRQPVQIFTDFEMGILRASFGDEFDIYGGADESSDDDTD